MNIEFNRWMSAVPKSPSRCFTPHLAVTGRAQPALLLAEVCDAHGRVAAALVERPATTTVAHDDVILLSRANGGMMCCGGGSRRQWEATARWEA